MVLSAAQGGIHFLAEGGDLAADKMICSRLLAFHAHATSGFQLLQEFFVVFSLSLTWRTKP
jgi:hypothetical protein